MNSMKDNLLSQLYKASVKRGITQQNAFQCFITAAVTALAGAGTLLLLNSNLASSESLTMQQEILALLAAIVAAVGLIVASISYLLLLVMRLSQPSSTSEQLSDKDIE